MSKKVTMQIGLTSELYKDDMFQLMLFETDKEIDYNTFLFTLGTVMNQFGMNMKDSQLTIYKSDKGYHIISLNRYNKYDLFRIAFELTFDDMICHKQLGFAIRQKSFTLRITEKTDITYLHKNGSPDITSLVDQEHEPKKIVYHQWGNRPISKPHYEIFKMVLNNPLFDLTDLKTMTFNNNISFFDYGYELKGYQWLQ